MHRLERPETREPGAVLRSEVERMLASARSPRRFAPAMERRYRDSNSRSRLRGFHQSIATLAGANVMALLVDVLVTPPTLLAWSLGSRLGLIVLLAGAIGLLAVVRSRTGILAIGFCACLGNILLAALPATWLLQPYADRYLITVILILLITVALVPWRRLEAWTMAGLGSLVLGAVAANAPTAGIQAQNLDIGLLAALMALVGITIHDHLEGWRRRSFLLRTLSTLTVEELEVANERLHRLSSTDALTGLPNRRVFDDSLANAWDKACAEHAWIGLAMVDVDHFKSYNDTAGHSFGDDCLRVVAQALAGAARLARNDVVARYGGEEFGVILHDAGPLDATTAAERLRQAVIDMALPHPGRPGTIVTVSVGVAALDAAATADGTGPLQLVAAADKALYRAKGRGRNCVVFQGGPDAPPLFTGRGSLATFGIVD
ncbi:GGDEF domain-containing protein [Zavarzinia sp. CC-PAN008]|uniref:GGDEF domain-containing protein n=1 Tax=Zavarzinia sp. CC-PAN008 TaxID=3243332 RepID=UPI003F7451E1